MATGPLSSQELVFYDIIINRDEKLNVTLVLAELRHVAVNFLSYNQWEFNIGLPFNIPFYACREVGVNLTVPKNGARVIDATGKLVIPGHYYHSQHYYCKLLHVLADLVVAWPSSSAFCCPWTTCRCSLQTYNSWQKGILFRWPVSLEQSPDVPEWSHTQSGHF